MDKNRYRYWLILLSSVLVGLCLSSCTVGIQEDTQSDMSVTSVASSSDLEAGDWANTRQMTDDQAQIKAFLGDLLFSERYSGAVPEAVKRMYADTDIGAPVVIANDHEGEGTIYLPLTREDRVVAVGKLALQKGRMGFSDILPADQMALEMFKVSQPYLEEKLEPYAQHVKTYAFVIEPSLYSSEHDDNKPLCQIETQEGQRLYYLYERGAFIAATEMAKHCHLTGQDQASGKQRQQ